MLSQQKKSADINLSQQKKVLTHHRICACAKGPRGRSLVIMRTVSIEGNSLFCAVTASLVEVYL